MPNNDSRKKNLGNETWNQLLLGRMPCLLCNTLPLPITAFLCPLLHILMTNKGGN